MMVRRLGGWYFGSRTRRRFRNPLSSTIEAGCKSIASILTSASSIFLRRNDSLPYPCARSIDTFRVTCLGCFNGVCSSLMRFTASCSSLTSLNSFSCLHLRCFNRLDVFPLVLTDSPQMVHTGSVSPLSLSKYVHTALLWRLLMLVC